MKNKNLVNQMVNKFTANLLGHWLQFRFNKRSKLYRAGRSNFILLAVTIMLSSLVNANAPDINSPTYNILNLGDIFEYQIVALDPDGGDQFTYALEGFPSGYSLSESGLITYAPTEHDQAGIFSYIIIVTDDEGEQTTQNNTISIRDPNNSVPRSSQFLSGSVQLDNLFVFNPGFFDPDGDNLVFNLILDPDDENIKILENGFLVWEPTSLIESQQISVIADDQHNGRRRFNYTVSVVPNTNQFACTQDFTVNANIDEPGVAPSDPASIWANTGNRLQQITTVDGTIRTDVLAPAVVSNILVSEFAERLWLATDEYILAFDLDGQLLQVESLPFAYDSQVPLFLANDQINASVWIANGDNVALLSSELETLVTFESNLGTIADISVDNSNNSIWLAQGSLLSNYSQFGELINQVVSSSPATALHYNDPFNALWLANQTELKNIVNGAQPLIFPQAAIIDVESRNNRVWAASVDQVFLLNQLAELNFSSEVFADLTENTDIRQIVIDPRGDTLWVLGDNNIRHIDGSGNITREIAFSNQAVGSTDECGPTYFSLYRDTQAPIITISSPNEGEVVEATSVDIIGSVSEPGSLTINSTPVTLAADLSFSQNVELLNNGENIIELQAQDLEQNTRTETLSVFLASDNNEPVITSAPVTQATTAELYQYNVTATDADNDPLTYGLVNAPAGMTINPTTGAINWTPDTAGLFNVAVQVGDGQAVVSQDFVITVAESNSAPQIVSNPITEATVALPYIYLVTAIDDNSDELTFSLENAPAGMSIDSVLGQINWVPQDNQLGSQSVTVIVSDGRGGEDAQTFTIEVNGPPVITSVPLATAVVDEVYQYQVVATDPNGDAVTFSLNTAPLGMTISDNGLVLWQPVGVQVAQVEISVTDTAGLQALQSYNLEVDFSDANLPPSLNNPGDQVVNLGEEFTFTLVATDPESQPVSINVAQLPMATGSSFNAGTGEFTFNASPENIGNNTFEFVANDGRFSVRQSFTIEVPEADTSAPTSFSARLMDANSLAQGGELPIINARVHFAGTEISTFSDNQGYFVLENLPVTGLQQELVLIVDSSTAELAPGGARYASFQEAFHLIAHVDNLISRPISLPRITSTSAIQVNPVLTTNVENEEIGVSFNIPPNTATNEDGSTFVGEISVTSVPQGFTPVALPEGVDPSLLVTIQPAGVRFITPVPITFPNTENYPPGTELDVLSLDPELGSFVVTGTGRVTANGQSIETISGGISRATWHGVFRQEVESVTPTQNNNNQQTCDANQPSGSFTCTRDGVLTNNIELQYYRSLEEDRGLGLVYRSKRTRPTNSTTQISNGTVSRRGYQSSVSLRVNYRTVFVPGPGGQAETRRLGITESRLSVGLLGSISESVSFNAEQLRNLSTVGSRISTVADIHLDTANLSTGVYSLGVGVSTTRLNGISSSRRFDNSADMVVVNGQGSDFGAGWMLDDVFELSVSSGRALMVSPMGNHVIYRQIEGSNNFTSADGDFSTLVRNSQGYLHTNKYGMTIQFDSNGRQISRADRNNNTTVYTYNGQGQLVTITDPVGLDTTLNYSNGKLVSTTDPAGRTSRFFYDSFGNLIRFVYPDGSEMQFAYEDSLMTEKTDERGNTTQYIYDNRGRNIAVILPDETTREINYQDSLAAADAAANTSDFPANVVSADDAIATFTDARGNPRRMVLGSLNRGTTMIDEIGRITVRELDSDGLPIRVERPIGSVYTRTYDSLGNMTQHREEFNGATYNYTYDEFSLITEMTNPRDHTTIMNRDDRGNLVESINHLGHTATMEYDSRGLVTRMVTPNNLINEYFYNQQGLLESIVQTPPPASPGNVRTTLLSYFATGLVQSITTPDQITYTMAYDERSRLTAVTDNLNQSVSYTYDPFGNIETIRTNNSNSTLARIVSNSFDQRNRLIQTTTPHIGIENSVIQYILDEESNLIGMVDPLNNSESAIYDAYHRPIQNTHRLDGITTYEYDDLDRLTSVTAPNGVVTRFTNDIIGRRTSEISPDRGTITYEYDLANNMTRMVDGRGVEMLNTFDELERLAGTSYPTSPREDVTYSYDDCLFGLGYRCARTDESGSYAYEYDVFGNMTAMFKQELGQDYVTRYAYDNGDNVISMQYPSGRVVDISRDGVRRIENITASVNGATSPIVSDMRYRGDNMMTQCTYGNGLLDQRSYDLQGRLINQSTGSIDSRAYAYDANSNMVSRDTSPQLSEYSYDPLDRLISDRIDSDIANTFNYDLNGNRLRKGQAELNEEEYTYLKGSNRLLATEKLDLTELADLQTVVARSTTYNDANRRYQVFEPGNESPIATYIFNADGQRTRKVTPSGITIYHYDMYGMLISETTETGELIKDYIWSGMSPVAQIDSVAGVDTVSFLHTDHLYTPRFATDSSGNIVWHWEGEAFGETGDQVFNVFTYNLRFPGQYYDVETDTHYNWMRAYDPETGRYAQSDPIGLNGGLNTFSYANLNSITHYDPRGEFGIIGAGIGAAIDLGFQLAANGGNLRCVNWGSVAVSAGLGAIGGGLANGLSKGAFKVWKPKPRKNLKHSFSGFKKWAKRNNVQAGIAKPGQQVHHTFAQQNQGWLKGLPNKYKNQPWNMNPVSPGLNNWMSRGNTNFRSLVGAPPWAKGVAGGGALAGGGAAVGGGNGCGC